MKSILRILTNYKLENLPTNKSTLLLLIIYINGRSATKSTGFTIGKLADTATTKRPKTKAK